MFIYPKNYDVIVVGAGHAGIEAALAAARLGATTLLLSQNLDTIGQMSCNPAVGGLAKGHMVREIDALGGFMGLNTDATAIQCRILNANKGPSVQAPRSQCDKKAYQFRAKAVCERQPSLDVKQGNAVRVLEKDGFASGVETNLGVRFEGKSVVITAGTFLRGLLHVGFENQIGGRMGDTSSTLSDSLSQLGFEIGRFKTGTPCRINARSIDFSVCEAQVGDDPPPPFSFMPELLAEEEGELFCLNRFGAGESFGNGGGLGDGKFHVEQIPCWITHTNAKTREIILANLDKSPMYCGRIEGIGPRYCPSIEDKMVRFADKPSHQLFLEPEGRHTEEYYINGISTSLPMEVQYAFVRSIKGLENAEIMRPGYAVEYDFFPPTQLSHTLETKRVGNLFFAGQINGTSGYEEAAAQGLVAGANAALKLQGKPPLALSRTNSYIGVLVDDLVTKGTNEPYRMFTSRAEHRLLLRHDNADLRLTPIGHESGLVSQPRGQKLASKQNLLAQLRAEADSTQFQTTRLSLWLKRPEIRIERDLPSELLGKYPLEIWRSLENELKYDGYIRRQELAIEKAKLAEAKLLPATLDYNAISGLRAEARQKLTAIRPATLGQASRIAGITPADLAQVSIWCKKLGSEI
jgi:tRNA uridine 5-carboxymethylaminomethyl modification enzyme